MSRAFIIVALAMSALGVVAIATHPAVSQQIQGKPVSPDEGQNGSVFPRIGL